MPPKDGNGRYQFKNPDQTRAIFTALSCAFLLGEYGSAVSDGISAFRMQAADSGRENLKALSTALMGLAAEKTFCQVPKETGEALARFFAKYAATRAVDDADVDAVLQVMNGSDPA